MQLVGRDYYHIFPSYGPEFRDMSSFEEYWKQNSTTEYHFQSGPCGGGILSQPLALPERERNAFARNRRPGIYEKAVYGLGLGNAAGERLSRCLSCCEPESTPAFVVKMGLAPRIPSPTVKATAEHAESLSDERYLLVVPKINRKSLKLLDELPGWFDHFGVKIDQATSDVPVNLREEMRYWFDAPDRLMYAFGMSGGEPNAAWQLAVVYYFAEYWDVHARGLDTVHFVANIEGKPCFRRNWTSNK